VRRVLAIVLAAAVAGALGGALIGYELHNRASADAAVSVVPEVGQAADTAPIEPASGPTPETIYKSDSPGVAVITDTIRETAPARLLMPVQKEDVGALGSGFVIDRKGDVVTNDHVVQGARDIRVGLGSVTTYPATIVGTDASSDLAVLRIKAPAGALHPLAFVDSAGVEVGDPAYAIGNPFGLDRTMTAGIVSATSRDIQAPNGLTIANAIQTDAPINRGNSGGPLLDRNGRVIGVNAQIESGTVNANVGVGFAIPSVTAKSVVSQLIAGGHARHAWLGVEAIDASSTTATSGLPTNGVVVVGVVNGSPAAKAGIEAAVQKVTANGLAAFAGGDTIVTVSGKPVGSVAQLEDEVARLLPGDKLKLGVVRGGATRPVVVTLGNAPA
jgi:S1-C subfamily serine protease